MISDYEICAKGVPTNVDEYEEISVEDFLKRENASPSEVVAFHNKYNAINIHFMLSQETYDGALELLADRLIDERLAKMNAIVFLSLKPKGRSIRNNYTPLSSLKFASLVNIALEKNIAFGFDSCSQKYFLDSVKNSPNYAQFEQMAESCESSKFSIFLDVNGDVFPCSFTPHTDGWETGISMVNENLDFLKDVWYEERFKKFRTKCIKCTSNNEPCPLGLIH